MNLTNVSSILEANSVYVCQVENGCTMYIPYFSENEVDDKLFKDSVAMKLNVVETPATDVVEDGYYVIEGIGICKVYLDGYEYKVNVFEYDNGTGHRYRDLVDNGYVFTKVSDLV